MGPEVSTSHKINGFDKWEVESDAEKMIKSEEIKLGDSKYYKTVMAEVDKIAKAATAAAKKKEIAANEIVLTKKVDGKLKKMYGKSSHNSSHKGGY